VGLGVDGLVGSGLAVRARPSLAVSASAAPWMISLVSDIAHVFDSIVAIALPRWGSTRGVTPLVAVNIPMLALHSD